MIQSTITGGCHVAIIMDGNGRWAEARHRPRIEGHLAGAVALRRVVESATELGIGTLTLYAFSSDNWKRPEAEVSALMSLSARTIAEEASRCRRQGVRVSVIGRRDRLPAPLCAAIQGLESATSACSRLHLRLAVDYSGRFAITSGAIGPDVDLLIRTGGEQRLSDFLLWECAYAELHFTPVMWPDFDGRELEHALDGFRRRERRFGGLPLCDTVQAV